MQYQFCDELNAFASGPQRTSIRRLLGQGLLPRFRCDLITKVGSQYQERISVAQCLEVCSDVGLALRDTVSLQISETLVPSDSHLLLSRGSAHDLGFTSLWEL